MSDAGKDGRVKGLCQVGQSGPEASRHASGRPGPAGGDPLARGRGDQEESRQLSRDMVALRGLSVVYHQKNATVEALREVTFSIGRGQTAALIGPSGCGKTTLLYVLAGLIPATPGEALVNNGPASAKRRQTALILQDYGLLPWKTVWQNAILGLEIRRMPKEQIAERGERILRELGLWEYRQHFPAQLSGGQRQRVGIARSLALNPDLLLMDEPFSSLDALTRENLQDTLLGIWQRDRVTILLVTHSIEEAVFLGQKIVVLSPRPGRVVAVLENPGMGQIGFRKDPAFHRLSNELRVLLGQGA